VSRYICSAAITLLALTLLSAGVRANKWRLARPDGRAPVGVVGADVVEEGAWRISYRFAYCGRDGLRVDTRDADVDEVLADYQVAPLRSTHAMHLIDGLYAVREWLVIEAVLPLLDQHMTQRSRSGDEYETRSSGLGDLRTTALLKVYDEGDVYAHFEFGVSMPTGSIDEMDQTPQSAPDEILLPYTMQLGSGTWDLITGFDFLRYYDHWSLGFRAGRVWRTYNNDRDYNRGYVFDSSVWAAFNINRWLAASARWSFRRQEGVSGGETYLDPSGSPSAYRMNTGWRRMDIPLGVNVLIPGGVLEGHRFAAEVAIPIAEDVNGPQLATDWGLTVGWHKDWF
jgi:hypothetical protein